jgi:hypothetical protein
MKITVVFSVELYPLQFFILYIMVCLTLLVFIHKIFECIINL